MNAPVTRGGSALPSDLANRVGLVLLDVDGVLTDAGVYIGATESGETVELKRFDIQDGLGMKFLQWAGMEVAIVSGRVSRATEIRAAELDIECYQDGAAQKLPVVREIMERVGVGWDEVAMLADDLPDMAVFERVGLRCAVANAVAPIAEIAHWQSSRRGGHGAVREFCDALLDARGDLSWIVEKYVSERSA
jgi:3-deoxy-D-manno-octulosonate 8-phosphate phosphatase (KDO 8-P phosphatase)